MANKIDHKWEFQGSPLEVKVYDSFDRAMRIFKALVQKERILSLHKEKSRYEKPSEKKRRKRNEMKRKLIELENKYNSIDLANARPKREDRRQQDD